jgi:hypothetical protein
LAPGDEFVVAVADALAAGRPLDGESQEEAGFRQAATIIGLIHEHERD